MSQADATIRFEAETKCFREKKRKAAPWLSLFRAAPSAPGGANGGAITT